MKSIITIFSTLAILSCMPDTRNTGDTQIMKWKDGKKGAISITYDDATINQFRKALPIMDSLGFKGTFYINTADIPESRFRPQYFGRPLEVVIKETATVPTSKNNLFERASAMRFLDTPAAIDYHNSAGALYESGKPDEAFAVVDKAFAEVRKKGSTRLKKPVLLTGEVITWEEIREFAARGHEFGSHTISHPRLAVLDEQNLLYELEKCKEELLQQLGPKHTFSAECPFGTENERVMEYALKIHPALRNRMPEPFLAEINRGNPNWPNIFNKEYIQWQRGPLTETPMAEMKSWVDTLLKNDNVWLVLTFHGVDGIGWEPKPHIEHAEYFGYMKTHESELWVATFQDVTKYMREHISSKIDVKSENKQIVIALTHSLDKTLYDFPLTIKTILPPGVNKVKIAQGNHELSSRLVTQDSENAVIFDAQPNAEDIIIKF